MANDTTYGLKELKFVQNDPKQIHTKSVAALGTSLVCTTLSEDSSLDFLFIAHSFSTFRIASYSTRPDHIRVGKKNKSRLLCVNVLCFHVR